MNRRRFSVLILGGVGISLLGGCGAQNPYKFRARVTVSVDTPEGVRSGSGVYEIWANWSYPGTTRRIWGERGEAIAVDLPNGRTLFSLLKTGAIHGDIASMVLAALDKNFDNTIVESTQRLSQASDMLPKTVAPNRVEKRYKDGRVIIEELSNYPLFVTFADINDPKTVALVDPNNLEATFGQGFRLMAVTVELTDEPITMGIEKRFTWWSKYRTSYFDGSSTVAADMTNPALAAHMSSGSFSTEYDR